jgi:hypothetical protein
MRRSQRKRPQCKLSTEEAAWGLDSSRTAQPKAEERTQDNGGSRKKLAVVCKRMARRTIPAPRKEYGHEGHGYKGPMVERRRRKRRTRGIVVQGTRKGPTFGRRRRAQPECSNGIRDRGARQRLRPRKETTTGNGIRRRSRKEELRLGSVKTSYEACGQTHKRIGLRKTNSRDFLQESKNE